MDQIKEVEKREEIAGGDEGQRSAMELVHRHTRISQEEIGKRFGNIDYSTVSRERKRLRNKMESDQSLKRSMKVIAAALDQK